MPFLANSPYNPQPDLELIKRRPITAAEAAQEFREFLDAENEFRRVHVPSGVTALTCERFNQVCLSEGPPILQCLEEDWMTHTDQGLLDCFVRLEARIEVHLNPCFLGDKLKHGLRKAAGDILLKYQRSLGCVPLTVADLMPVGSAVGAIVGCAPYVHFLASFRSVGFQPRLRNWIIGRMSKEQSSYGVNINVLKLLNVFVHRNDPKFPHELKFDSERRAWLLKESPLGEKHLVIFRVTKKNRDNVGEVGIVLQGHIESTDHIKNTVQEETIVKKKKSQKNDNHSSPAASSMEASLPGSASMQCPPTDGKKKRKSNADASTAASVGVETGPSHGVESMEEPTPKKRKKKDNKDEAAPPDAEEPTVRKKKHKDETPLPDAEEPTPKSSKKKKRE